MTEPILAAHGLSKKYGEHGGLLSYLRGVAGAEDHHVVHALDDVSLTVAPREVLGIVGESGCGKSTLGRLLARLETPDTGSVDYPGAASAGRSRADARRARLATQMIFQDPWASLNPRLTVRNIIGEAPLLHGLVSRAELTPHVTMLMKTVGLPPSYIDRFPHQLSGGQRQRVGIARALAVKPQVLICDEVVSALDVSIQAQILRLFRQLRAELGITFVFISHDLGVIRVLSDRILVMYMGRVVETGTTQRIFARPAHPYTKALLSNAPHLTTKRRTFKTIAGELPSPYDPPKGCAFHTRCPFAFGRCRSEVPQLRTDREGHQAACHLPWDEPITA